MGIVDIGESTMRKLPKGLELLGAVITTTAFFWWLIFFADKGIEKYLKAFVVCFVYTTGLCAGINAVAEFAGGIGFYPIVSWIGIVCMIVGAALDRSSGGDVVVTKDD